MPPKKSAGASPLQRGSACLCCRKRKLKCDGNQPVCRVCFKMNRADECEYDDKKQKSRTQKLREKLAQLEDRIRELESDPSVIGSNASLSLDSQGSSSGLEVSSTNFNPQDFDFSILTDLDKIANPSLGPAWYEAGTSSGSSSALSNSPMYGQVSLAGSPDSGNSERDFNAQFDISTFPGFNATSGLYMPRWDPADTLPFENHKILLEIFIAHRQQCWYDGDVARFDIPSHAAYPQEPHPALMNAVYLLACHFARSPSFSEFEPVFYSRTLQNITLSLDHSDRLVDIVQASSLLAIYLYSNKRALEGYCHAFSAARLAVGLGLHQLRPLQGDPEGNYYDMATAEPTPIPLSPPQNAFELRERIATFWQVFMIDRCWTVANGLPVALPDGDCHLIRIRTPWPAPFYEIDPLNHQVFDDPSILQPSGEYLPALRVKAAALYERTFRLSAVPSKNDTYWTEYHASQQALQRFMATLPPFTGFEAWRTQAPFLNTELLAVHTLVHVSTIHLQKDHFEQDALQCATSVTALIQQISDADYEYLDPILASCWLFVAKLFIQLNGPHDPLADVVSVDPLSASPYHAGLAIMVRALKTLNRYVPLASEYVKKIEEECGPAVISLLKTIPSPSTDNISSNFIAW